MSVPTTTVASSRRPTTSLAAAASTPTVSPTVAPSALVDQVTTRVLQSIFRTASTLGLAHGASGSVPSSSGSVVSTSPSLLSTGSVPSAAIPSLGMHFFVCSFGRSVVAWAISPLAERALRMLATNLTEKGLGGVASVLSGRVAWSALDAVA